MAKKDAAPPLPFSSSLASFAPLTPPAIAATVGYVIMAIVVLLPFDMYVYDEQRRREVRTPYNPGARVLLLLLLFFPFFLGVYSVNCMVVGNCLVWSWIVAAATLLWSCIVILTAISYKAFRLDDIAY